jgi:hypothetical protein
VTDEQAGRHSGSPHGVGGSHQVLHVQREARVGEAALAVAEPGEVEAKHPDAHTGQLPCDAHGREVVLAAGEAVREERPTPLDALGQFEAA